MSTSHLISSYGYRAIFAFIAAESLGVPIPGETALIAAGAYAGHTHHLNPWAIFAVAAVSAVAGNVAGYLIGMKGGFALARRYGSKVRLDERKLKVGRYVLDRQGGKVVFFGRFVSVCAPIFPSSPAPCIWSGRGSLWPALPAPSYGLPFIRLFHIMQPTH
jgi:membrane protein DedA with SNARE-associated domain